MGRLPARIRANFSMNCSVLAFFRSQCDGDHSRGPRNRIGQTVSRLAVSVRPKRERVRSQGRSVYLGMTIPRCRALGLGAKRGPRADLPQREGKSAAPALFSAGSGAALAIFNPRSPDAKLHMHAAMDALGALRAVEPRGRARGHASARTKPGPARRWPGCGPPWSGPTPLALGPCRARQALYAIGS